jgi:hypothetical protein
VLTVSKSPAETRWRTAPPWREVQCIIINDARSIARRAKKEKEEKQQEQVYNRTATPRE